MALRAGQEYNTSLVIVPESSGGYRPCVDLTELNQMIEREQYVLLTVDETLGQLGEAKVFSKLNATSGFHKVKLSDMSEELTPFITPLGLYSYRRLPFGLASVPELVGAKWPGSWRDRLVS